jgi:GT2 family glycosyltransferase
MLSAGSRVSAIVPAYNRASLLEETLRSLLAQHRAPDEVIVVDDGSDDDIAGVAARFNGKVRYVRIANGGAPAARNLGASLATGDWLWFCDSDDLWHPAYLDRAMALAAVEPGLDFIFGNFRLVRDGRWESQTKFQTAPQGFWQRNPGRAAAGGRIFAQSLYAGLLCFQPVFHSTLLVSRRLFNAIGGYDPRFGRLGSEDFEFVLRCAAHGRAGMIEEALVGIRRHGENHSASQLGNLLGELAILRHARDHHGAPAVAAASLIDEQIGLRTRQALELAFAAADYPQVLSLARTLPPSDMDPRTRLKIMLASWPRSLRRLAVGLAVHAAGRRQGPAMRRVP